jgi:beta-N-acetylhexosaminidase
MRIKLVLFIILAIFISVISGCEKVSTGNNSDKTIEERSALTNDTLTQGSESTVEKKDLIKEQIEGMSLDEEIGQMVIVGLAGYTIDDNSRRMLEDYHVGGFIVYGLNVENTDQLLNLTNSLKEGNLKNKVPLFISVDEEGGKVDRMPGEFKRYPANKTIGEVNNKDFSYKLGNVIAEEIKMLGFNMDFAPVLDINSNPKNPVIGDRSFGSTEGVVSSLGIQTMMGLQSGNVIPVVKHFPGHGDTSTDSHIGLPSVDNDLDRLNSFELVPFKEAIKNNADAVMIAHILLPKIDPENPSTLSKIIITDILRNQLNFTGVIITDDMTMGAIVKNYKIEDAAVKSVNAGSDIILIAHEYDNAVLVINALKAAVENGIISKERIDDSVYRILKLKQKYSLTDNIINSVNVDEINNQISTILNTYLNK